MTEPFIAHSELTDEIYVVCGREKYRVTEQVIRAVESTGKLNDIAKEWLSTFNTDSATQCYSAIQELKKEIGDV